MLLLSDHELDGMAILGFHDIDTGYEVGRVDFVGRMTLRELYP